MAKNKHELDLYCCTTFRLLKNASVNIHIITYKMGFPSGSDDKESACNAGDLDSNPGSGRSPGEGNGYPFTDRGA